MEKTKTAGEFILSLSKDILDELAVPQNWQKYPELDYIYDMKGLFWKRIPGLRQTHNRSELADEQLFFVVRILLKQWKRHSRSSPYFRWISVSLMKNLNCQTLVLDIGISLNGSCFSDWNMDKDKSIKEIILDLWP